MHRVSNSIEMNGPSYWMLGGVVCVVCVFVGWGSGPITVPITILPPRPPQTPSLIFRETCCFLLDGGAAASLVRAAVCTGMKLALQPSSVSGCAGRPRT